MSQPVVLLFEPRRPSQKERRACGARSAKVVAGFASDRAPLFKGGRMILSPNRSHSGGSCATARGSALAILRGQIERIETSEAAHHRDRVALGHPEADSALQGGLARAAIHEVFCEGRQGTAATGFVAGLAGRVTT